MPQLGRGGPRAGAGADPVRWQRCPAASPGKAREGEAEAREGEAEAREGEAGGGAAREGEAVLLPALEVLNYVCMMRAICQHIVSILSACVCIMSAQRMHSSLQLVCN